MNARNVILIMSSGLLGATLAISATHAQSTAPATTATSGAADPSAFASGPGADLVQARCTACHAASVVTTKRYDEQKWRDVVEQMIAKGAQVGDDDYDAVVAYLVKHYGPVR